MIALLCFFPLTFADEVRLPSAGAVPAGEALVIELGCLNCHQGQGALAERFAARGAPLLDQVGGRRSAESLRGFLAAPHKLQPGTSMPDMLGSLPVGEREESLEDLVHYLASRGGPLQLEPFQATEDMLIAGRKTLHQVGCVACHIPEESVLGLQEPFELKPTFKGAPPTLDDEDRYVSPGTLAPPPIPFGDLAGRTSVGALTAFLLDPLAVRPEGRMPSMNLSKVEARNIATYLLREQCEVSGFAETAGMRYAYYEERFDDGQIILDGLTPARVGVIVEEFEPLEEADQLVHLKHRADYFAFEFTGTLLVKEAGVYGFRTQSDDGSFVYVDGELVVDNGGFHGVLSAEGSVELKVGAHSVRILYFEGGGGNELMVHWSGPGFDERPLRGDDLVYRTLPMQPLQAKVFSADPARVERGQTQFTKLGCVACHEAPTLQAPAFGAWNVQSSTGCLSPTPGLGAPRYGWSPEQQAAVREQVEKLDSLAPQTAAQRVQGLMARNSCYACHRRDEIGGPHPARGDYFASQPGVDLGEEGRIPPLLDAVGSKLHRDWLHKVLSEGASARPALLTRMPQFAADNMEALEAALVEADALTNPPRPGPFSAEAMSAGRQLAGTQGFGCIQCHTFNGYRSLGIQAVDLGDVTERIQYPWFRELLEDPVGLGMNSRMPLFWIDGKSPLPDLLGGDIEAQIDALWNYLAMGDSMQLPEGLNVPDSAYEVDIQPGDDPKVVGVFMRGLSPRVVAVGTGALVHYAFDVENSRLAKAWRGRFFNARGTWEGRAGQLELPPTQEVHEFPEGSPFAILEDAQGAWPTTENRAPLLRSRGRRFDEERRPIFRYALGEIEIEETPVTFLEGSQGVLVRRFKLRAPQRITKLYYQSARGRQRVTFEVTPDGSYKATLEERITW